MKPKSNNKMIISTSKKIKLRTVFFVSLMLSVLLIFGVYFSTREISIYDDSTNLVVAELNDPDKGTYLPEEFMNFQVISKPDASYKEVAFTGVKEGFSNTTYTTLALPSTVKLSDGITYNVTKVDIPYPRDVIGVQSVIVTHSNPEVVDQEGRLESGYVPVATEAFQKTSAFLSQRFKALILPGSIREVAEASLWGFASLEYMKVPFIGTRRITKTLASDPDAERLGVIGTMFGGERGKNPSYLRYSTYNIKTGNTYEPDSSKLSMLQVWIKNTNNGGAVSQQDYIPCGLKKLIITGEEYRPSTGINDYESMEVIPTRALYDTRFLETIIIGTRSSTGENNLKRISKIGV